MTLLFRLRCICITAREKIATVVFLPRGFRFAKLVVMESETDIGRPTAPGKEIMKSMAFALAVIGSVAIVGTARADISRLPPDVIAGIAAMGPNLDPSVIAKTRGLMDKLSPHSPPATIKVTKDVAYGDDPLQKIDVYVPAHAQALPIAIFVHGGGFVGGDKSDYDNIPTYLSQHGIVAVNANYRLAPKVTWPAASDDVGAVVAFLKQNAARYGGDPQRIVLIGHSAGANAVASYVLDPSIHPEDGPGVVAAVLISLPASRVTSIGQRDHAYFGADASLYAKRAPASHVGDSKLPLMLVTAEFDPVTLAPDAYQLAAEVCVRDGKCPRFLYVNGHNHISEVASIGSPDDQLARPLVDFVRQAR
jgi:acetyl esterase